MTQRAQLISPSTLSIPILFMHARGSASADSPMKVTRDLGAEFIARLMVEIHGHNLQVVFLLQAMEESELIFLRVIRMCCMQFTLTPLMPASREFTKQLMP